MTDLITPDPAAIARQIQATADRATDYRAKAKAANTLAAYRSDWNDFTTWCTTHNLQSLPATPATVTLYITDLAEHCKPSTITRRLATISQAHQQAGHATPTTAPVVRDVLQGIKREKGTAPAAKASSAIERVFIAPPHSRPVASRVPSCGPGGRAWPPDRDTALWSGPCRYCAA